MFGIKILKTATKNELRTKDGRVFELDDKKNIHLTTALVIDFLKQRNFFNEVKK